jgi:hypothetical protein
MGVWSSESASTPSGPMPAGDPSPFGVQCVKAEDSFNFRLGHGVDGVDRGIREASGDNNLRPAWTARIVWSSSDRLEQLFVGEALQQMTPLP